MGGAAAVRLAVKLGLGTVAVVVVILLFLFPVHTLIAQHNQSSADQRRLKGLSQENKQLNNQAALLQTPGEIQRIARSQYGLVKPGQRAFAILPPTSPPTTAKPRKH